MINVLLINRHSYKLTFMPLLEGAHEYYNGKNDQDDSFIMMMMILEMKWISKYSWPNLDFATR